MHFPLKKYSNVKKIAALNIYSLQKTFDQQICKKNIEIILIIVFATASSTYKIANFHFKPDIVLKLMLVSRRVSSPTKVLFNSNKCSILPTWCYNKMYTLFSIGHLNLNALQANPQASI